MAISKLVDKPEITMKFDIDETKADEGHWFMDLVKINDDLGDSEDVQSLFQQGADAEELKETTKRESLSHRKPRTKTKPEIAKMDVKNSARKIIAIEEIDDEEDDDDLAPYAKPDSDPEDEEEDPTMVQRNKPVAPV